MNIAVASTGHTLDAGMAPQLERSKYLLILDFDTMEFVTMLNPLMMLSGPAAGKMLGQQLSQENVWKILTGKCHSGTLKSVGSAGIQVIAGMSGSVRDAVVEFREMCLANTCIISHTDLHIQTQ